MQIITLCRSITPCQTPINHQPTINQPSINRQPTISEEGQAIFFLVNHLKYSGEPFRRTG